MSTLARRNAARLIVESISLIFGRESYLPARANRGGLRAVGSRGLRLNTPLTMNLDSRMMIMARRGID